MRKLAAAALLLALIPAFPRLARAHEPGQSLHGEAFDRGPRQDAYLMGGTGDVHFPVTSSKNPLVQQFIEQGVGQLHGFWFVEAERSFRKAWSLDPDCGIAYWGMSLANHLNPVRAKQFAEMAAKHKGGLSKREQMYIEALSSETGYQDLIDAYPDDIEAKAFEVWRIWHRLEAGIASAGEVALSKKLSAQILRVNPRHPIHHELIHLADSEDSEAGALNSAALCGETAPSIGHMWHMPTHIYFPLKRYAEAAWQLEASIRTEHARMIHDRVLPDQVHLYAHNNEWLVRTLLYLGRVHDARRTAMQMIDLPRHPLLNVIEPPEKDDKNNDNEDDPRGKERPVEVHGTSAYYGRDRLLQVLRQSEYWSELIDACNSNYIEMTRLPAEQAKIHVNLGVAWYCQNEVAKGDAELEKLRQLQKEQVSQKAAAIREIKTPRGRQRSIEVAHIDERFARPLVGIQRGIRELESYRTILTGFFLSRTQLLICLGVLALAEGYVAWSLRRRIPVAILSGMFAIAAGIWLFKCHLALIYLPYTSYQVDFAFMSRKQLEAGDPEIAEWCAREYALNREGQVRPQANLIEILYRIGKKEDARQEFELLRELAGMADLDTPNLARLQPIAKEFGLPTDWRLPAKMQKALAGRRALPSLGPLVWRPWTAPNWTLQDADGKPHSLTDFKGKPVMMLFFLGKGCLHCKEQLEAFGKKAAELKKAGFTVIAVSTDDRAGIRKSLDDFKPGPFPFLMLADPNLDVFQSYRAFDNFEQIALHGTFAIDPEGFVRWQDVSFQPFKDVNFVLAESQRLMSRPAPPVEAGARLIADAPVPAPLSTASARR